MARMKMLSRLCMRCTCVVVCCIFVAVCCTGVAVFCTGVGCVAQVLQYVTQVLQCVAHGDDMDGMDDDALEVVHVLHMCRSV